MIEFFLYAVLFALAGTYAYAGWQTAPWVPTRKHHVDRAMRLADVKSGTVFADLGCGDGRLVHEAARKGAMAHGYEIAIVPFLLAVWRNRRVPNARIHFRSLWNAELRNVDVVYLFLMPKAAHRIKAKLEQELKSGAVVITYVWPMEGWTAEEEDALHGELKLYKYRIDVRGYGVGRGE